MMTRKQWASLQANPQSLPTSLPSSALGSQPTATLPATSGPNSLPIPEGSSSEPVSKAPRLSITESERIGILEDTIERMQNQFLHVQRWVAKRHIFFHGNYHFLDIFCLGLLTYSRYRNLSRLILVISLFNTIF